MLPAVDVNQGLSQGKGTWKRCWAWKWSRSAASLEGWRHRWTGLNTDEAKEGRRR